MRVFRFTVRALRLFFSMLATHERTSTAVTAAMSAFSCNPAYARNFFTQSLYDFTVRTE
jgi:hypothetical protein